MISRIGEQLKEYFRTDGVQYRPGASEDDIKAFEQRYNVMLPEDLRSYFRTTNGFDEDKTWCDGNLFTFLSLDAVYPLSQGWWNVPVANTFFVIVDFLISSHVYAIRLTKTVDVGNPVVVSYGSYGDGPIQIANSFTAFAEGYMEGKATILDH